MNVTRPFMTITLLLICGFFLLATCVQQPTDGAEQLDESVPALEVAEVAPPLSPEQKALETRLSEIGEGFAGEFGIGVVEVASGAEMAFNGEALFPQQSVTKLWVALAALDRVDGGELDLAEPVTIRREDLTVFYQPVRNIVTVQGQYATDYRDLFERALTQSDNTANDRLLRRIGGPQSVEAFFQRKHIGGVRFGVDERTKQSAIAGLKWDQRYSVGNTFFDVRDDVPDAIRQSAFEGYLADPVDGASAVGIAKALARLARGELLKQGSPQLILSTLENTKSGPQRRKGGVPSGWKIAHKTGTGQVYAGDHSGYNDVGVLTAPDGKRYALAVLIGRTRTSYQARFEMMQSVTRAVVDYHESVTAQNGV